MGRGEILKDPVHLTFLDNRGVCFNELTVKCDIVGFMLYKGYSLLMSNGLHDS